MGHKLLLVLNSEILRHMCMCEMMYIHVSVVILCIYKMYMNQIGKESVAYLGNLDSMKTVHDIGKWKLFLIL